MISLLLLSFATFTKAQVLFDYIYIFSGYTKEEVKNYKEEYQKEYDELMKECIKDENMKDTCEIKYEAYKPCNMITENEVEETIKNIDALSLMILSYGYNGKIDLSQLKGRAEEVTILQTDKKSNLNYSKINNSIEKKPIEMKNIKPDFSHKNILQFHKHLVSHKKASKASGIKSVLEIVGDVKNKVGYLNIVSVLLNSGTIRIIDSPLNSNNVEFLYCTIASDSQPIHSNYLTVDLFTYKSLGKDKYKSNQFFLSLFGSIYNDYIYKRIHYTTSGWELYYSINGNSFTKITFNLPYELTETFGILTNSLHFLISRVIEEFDIKGLNITIGEFPTEDPDLKEKEAIHIKLDDVWKDSPQKPNINVVADKSQYELDPNNDIKADLNDHYNDHHKQPDPPKKSNKTGIIIGVVVAIVVVIAVVVVVVVVIVIRKKRNAKAASSNQEGGEYNADNNASHA